MHPSAPASKKQILLVVDDWEALEVYEDFLDPHFELRSAPFGKLGLELARERRPERIFVDLTFEDMHPGEFCELIRRDAATRTVPLTVVFSEGEAVFERAGVFPLAVDQVLKRPFERMRLLDLLRL